MNATAAITETLKTEPPRITNDLAGAIGVYVEARRKLADAWGDQRAVDTRIAAAVREDYAAGAALLDLVWKNYGNGGPRR
jgi:hypothetical protein